MFFLKLLIKLMIFYRPKH